MQGASEAVQGVHRWQIFDRTNTRGSYSTGSFSTIDKITPSTDSLRQCRWLYQIVHPRVFVLGGVGVCKPIQLVVLVNLCFRETQSTCTRGTNYTLAMNSGFPNTHWVEGGAGGF